MKILDTYEHINHEQWQNLLQTSPTTSWFQSADAYLFLRSIPNIVTPFVFAVEENEQLQAVVVGYITQEKTAFKQHFTQRAIIHGGILLAPELSNKALQILLQKLSTELKNCIYIEFRNYHDYSRYKPIFSQYHFDYHPHFDFHVSTISMEKIIANLSEGRKRDINNTQRNGATIIERPTMEQVHDFYDLLQQLYKQKIKKPLFDWEFFEQLYRQPTAAFLLVQYEKKIIGGTVCVGNTKTLYEWFVCGLDGQTKGIFPSSYATFIALQFACKNGYECFDMMGAGVPNEAYGVRDFKARFGGKLVEYGRFIKINKWLRYQIGKIGIWCMQKL